MGVTEYTYKKLKKAGSVNENWEKVISQIKRQTPFPSADIVVCTRGRNKIGYYRPNRGEYINDKIFSIYIHDNGMVDIYL